MKLEELRDQLTKLDTELLGIVARRQALISRIGETKRAGGQPTRDFQREREVIQRGRATAAELEISPNLAETLLKSLIESSLTKQEHDRVLASGTGEGKTALILGGAGKLGRWLAGFLASQGFGIQTADPTLKTEDSSNRRSWTDFDLAADLIVIATPLDLSGKLMVELAKQKPPGLVFDVASLKGPVKSGIEALSSAGCRVASIHPMFGPDTQLLSGRHVIFVETGCESGTKDAKELFAHTMAQLVDMPLEEHDRVMSYVLGLSHAINLAFSDSLRGSGETAVRLADVSSTTFDAQLEVARRVSEESPDLYYEIQRRNQHGPEALERFIQSISSIMECACADDGEAFESLMTHGRDYLRGLRR